MLSIERNVSLNKLVIAWISAQDRNHKFPYMMIGTACLLSWAFVRRVRLAIRTSE